MNQILIFIIGVVVGVVIGRVSFSGKSSTGFAERNKEMQEEKKRRKNRILELLQEQGSVANDDVQAELGVSDTTATAYMQELEDEGRIVQVGKEGRFVRYKLK